MKRGRGKGFTLIELMVTIAVLGILLAVAVPSFVSMVANNRSVAASNELMTALNMARAEAVRRGSRISICPSSNGTACSGSGGAWASGWIVFTDSASSDTAATATVHVVLSRHGALPSGAVVTSGPTFVRFSGLGTAPRGVASFSIKVSPCSGSNARAIQISASGRVAMAQATCS